MTGTGPGSNSSARMNLDDLELELRRLPGVRAAGFTDRDDVLLIQLQVSGDRPPANLPLQATRIAYRHSEKPVALEVVRWRVAPDGVDGDGPSEFAAAPGAPAVELPPPPLEPVAAQPAGVPTVEVAAPAAEEVHIDAEPAVPEPVASESAAATESPGVIPVIPTTPDEPGDRWPRVRLLAVLTFPDTDELEVHLTFGGRRIIGRSVASTGILAVVEAMVDGLQLFAPGLEFRPSWARVLDDDRGRDIHVVACELIAPDDSRRLGIASGASAIEAAARATLHALNRSIAQHLTDVQEPDPV